MTLKEFLSVRHLGSRIAAAIVATIVIGALKVAGVPFDAISAWLGALVAPEKFARYQSLIEWTGVLIVAVIAFILGGKDWTGLGRKIKDALARARWREWRGHFMWPLTWARAPTGPHYAEDIQFQMENVSRRPLIVTEAYALSLHTGERLPIVFGTDIGYVDPKDLNPIPPGAKVECRAFLPTSEGPLPKGIRRGIVETEFMDRWGSFVIRVGYGHKTYERTFSAKEIRARLPSWHPKSSVPKATAKAHAQPIKPVRHDT